MITFLSRLFFSTLPKQWLTPLNKMVNGETVPLNEQELRERHTESFSNLVKSRIQRANIIGNYLAIKQEESARNKHYFLIGKLCVLFSNLEQEVKQFLIELDDDEAHEWKSGKNLVDAFKKTLKNHPVDEECKADISAFLDEFLIVAQERNSVLKTSYTYLIERKRIHRVDLSFFNINLSKRKTFDIDNIYQEFDEEQHRKLISKIIKLTISFPKIKMDFRWPFLKQSS